MAENPYYGLGGMAGDLTAGFREAEKEAEDQRRYETGLGFQKAQESRAQEGFDMTMEGRRAALERTRQQMRAEGGDEAVRLILSGRLKEAERVWNETGSQRIKPGSLKYDRKTGLVTWVEADGTEGAAVDRMLAAIAGISMDGGKGKGRPSASLQLLREYTRIFGDERMAAYILNMAKRDPTVARSRIFNALVKANESRMLDEQLSPEELWKKAGEMVDESRQAEMETFGLEPPGAQPPATPGALPPNPDAGVELPQINPNDPETWSSLWSE